MIKLNKINDPSWGIHHGTESVVRQETYNNVLSNSVSLYNGLGKVEKIKSADVIINDSLSDRLIVNDVLGAGKLHIFVTGSNAKLLSGELATHLTGRYNEIHLYPFSFLEYCQYHKVELRGITTKADAERKRAFMDYIHDGGFYFASTKISEISDMAKCWATYCCPVS